MHEHHEIDARAAEAAAMVLPAGAVLRVPLVDRQRRVFVGMMRGVIQRLVAALALLQAEPIGQVVKVDAAFQFVNRGHRFVSWA
ncbi:hypothetical protein [Burkholderia vietnamiensis]|uniref:hypothetical protein n=1 Tax=Burkholderia vietnamiensis TaxID=60552 RepID=UPI002011DB9C|nr:hypothetical protein [Burkholderia vietnamiensis]